MAETVEALDDLRRLERRVEVLVQSCHVSLRHSTRTEVRIPVIDWKPGKPDSAIVGRSGNSDERFSEVTAMSRILPLFRYATAVETVEDELDVSAQQLRHGGGAALVGNVLHLHSSHRFHELAGHVVGMPQARAQVSLAGFVLVYAIRSFTECTGSDGCTTSMLSADTPRAIGVKSFSGS